jgi:hypothetical protein
MTTKSYFACIVLIVPMALTLPALGQTRATAKLDSEPQIAFGQAQTYIGVMKSKTASASAAKQQGAELDCGALTSLECKMFAHSYAHDSVSSRVARLERLICGATRDGLPVQQRISSLVADVRNGCTAAAAVPDRIPTANSATSHATAENGVISKQAIGTNSMPGVRYPHVTELEHQICRRTFETEPIRQRLDRLENVAFGKRSDSVDLARRVDALDWYAFAAPPVKTAEYADENSEFDLEQHSADFRHFPALASTSSVPQFVSVVDQIECLERTSFGRISANKPLEKRVSALEKHVYGTMPVNTNEALTARVAQLWASVTTGSSGGPKHSGV